MLVLCSVCIHTYVSYCNDDLLVICYIFFLVLQLFSAHCMLWDNSQGVSTNEQMNQHKHRMREHIGMIFCLKCQQLWCICILFALLLFEIIIYFIFVDEVCCWCLLLCCSCWMCRPWYVLLIDWILNINWLKVKYNCSWGVCIECHTTYLRINIPVMWISGVQWEDHSYKSRSSLFH